ncbi:guanylate kinase [Actinomyces sp. zg-332]|uniref:guanylate kinase n=1 Tax=Actinomyces sp. zg-332 TaxID=2708340 RepID=UPI0014216044|nr:guanylate kinase [Actinomyces sp. zg-332]QPK94614.1 guanylate kinase [Actinomyces sp. zg-332]
MSEKLYVIAGPSGVGKGTIVSRLIESYPNIFLSISMTTRLPRPGEQDGVHYYFVDKEKFEFLVKEKKILEYAFVHGLNYYGTPLEPVEKALENGKPCILEIDLDGVRQVKEIMGERATYIFVSPPSWQELEKRLVGRGTEDIENVTKRLETAKIEMAAQDEFDYVVVNDILENAVDEIATIMNLK